MKVLIRIHEEASGGKRAVYFGDELSHHIREGELEETLKEARFNAWKTDAVNGRSLGERLHRFLNGSGGQLDRLLKEARDKAEALSVVLKAPFELNALPFELLNNGQFLSQLEQPRVYIVRAVSDRGSRRQVEAQKRPLKVLFMACSPVDLKAREVLSFEKEEEQILSSVEQFAVDVTVEDSGSLSGLFLMLQEEGPFDIVHITGHAGHDAGLGPVFYMEDDTGGLDKVSPQRLWEEALKEAVPELLFLSGCSTGKADKASGAESFAHQMVDKGVTRVLGWGLPVLDVGASRMTAELYRVLAMGKSIVEAVHSACRVLEELYHPWPLLRVFSDGAPLMPLVAAGQVRRFQKRQAVHKALLDSQVQVLERGFVGRRRELQRGVRVLKGTPDDDGERRFGVLIRGPAGIGKSCLAGKLVERFKELELVVVRGRLSQVSLVGPFKKLFDRKGAAQGIEVLKSDLEYEDKIKGLFREVFVDLPVMIYLDDFEQNLVSRGDYWEVEPEVVPVLRPMLQALDWQEDSRTRLLISSRYRFELEHEGDDLAGKLADIPLMAFRGADVEKKAAELPNIAKSAYRGLYLSIGCGNPRLMEWLEVIAADEGRYDLESLKQALEGKSQEYITEYLADFIKQAEGKEFGGFLQRAAVYRRPVEASAYAAIGERQLLEKGVDLTLFEKERTLGGEPVYWVMPVIREKQWQRVAADERKALHAQALSWYEGMLAEVEAKDPELLLEAVYHGLEADRVRAACGHAADLGAHLDALLLYRDKLQVLQAVAERVTQEVVNEPVHESSV